MTRLVLLAVLLAGTSCAGITGRRDVSSWLEARGADTMDLFGIRIGFGPGLGVLVRATEYVQLGAMYRGPSESHLAGATAPSRPDGFRLRAVPCVMLGTIGRYGGVWYDSTAEIALPGFSTRDGPVPVIYREIIAGVVPLDGRDDGWRGSFGVGLHALLVGGEVEVRPFELFDLLGGLIGYDPSGDDVPVADGMSGDDAS